MISSSGAGAADGVLASPVTTTAAAAAAAATAGNPGSTSVSSGNGSGSGSGSEAAAAAGAAASGKEDAVLSVSQLLTAIPRLRGLLLMDTAVYIGWAVCTPLHHIHPGCP